MRRAMGRRVCECGHSRDEAETARGWAVSAMKVQKQNSAVVPPEPCDDTG